MNLLCFNKCNLAIQLQTKEGIFRLTGMSYHKNLAGEKLRMKKNKYICPVFYNLIIITKTWPFNELILFKYSISRVFKYVCLPSSSMKKSVFPEMK